MVCNKCNVDKEVKEFSTYYHSTQKKHRTRKICTECFNKQKVEYRIRMKQKVILTLDPDILFKDDPNYKKCLECKEWKSMDNYYGIKSKATYPRCIPCERERSRKESEDRRIENGGGQKVPPKPNKYTDKYQRENTFEIMALMGYTFDEPTGIWFKPGWKEIVNGKPVFTQIKKTSRNFGNIKKLSKEEVNQIFELRERGWTVNRISIKTKYSNSKINSVLKNGK